MPKAMGGEGYRTDVGADGAPVFIYFHGNTGSRASDYRYEPAEYFLSEFLAIYYLECGAKKSKI